jgi:hypothetical protein
VPLNDMAVKVMKRQIGRHPVHVFTYLGEPIKQVSTKAWYNALKRAGIAIWPRITSRSTRAIRKSMAHSWHTG